MTGAWPDVGVGLASFESLQTRENKSSGHTAQAAQVAEGPGTEKNADQAPDSGSLGLFDQGF